MASLTLMEREESTKIFPRYLVRFDGSIDQMGRCTT